MCCYHTCFIDCGRQRDMSSVSRQVVILTNCCAFWKWCTCFCNTVTDITDYSVSSSFFLCCFSFYKRPLKTGSQGAFCSTYAHQVVNHATIISIEMVYVRARTHTHTVYFLFFYTNFILKCIPDNSVCQKWLTASGKCLCQGSILSCLQLCIYLFFPFCLEQKSYRLRPFCKMKNSMKLQPLK